MLENTLVSPELSSTGQLRVPGELHHVAGGEAGQLVLLAPRHPPPQVVVESQDLLLGLTAHTPAQDLPTAISRPGLTDRKYFMNM